VLGCELLFGEAKGARIRAMIEDAIGGPCPCVLGAECPLLGTLLESPAVPRPRAVEPEPIALKAG
jgi:hypothetical protein